MRSFGVRARSRLDMVGKIVITATHLPGESKKPERRERSRADHVGQAWGRRGAGSRGPKRWFVRFDATADHFFLATKVSPYDGLRTQRRNDHVAAVQRREFAVPIGPGLLRSCGGGGVRLPARSTGG